MIMTQTQNKLTLQTWICAIYAIKEIMVPALSSIIINTKYKGAILKIANLIKIILALQNPTESGKTAIVSLDKYNSCKVVIDNCDSYDITIARNEMWVFLNLSKKVSLLVNNQFY
jgi:hypothetical protein